MSFLEYRVKYVPSGLSKVLYVNWGLYLVMTAIAAIGWLMLYSISGGDLALWAEPQMKRFAVGFVLALFITFTPIWFWRSMSFPAYLATFFLLILVMLIGRTSLGAQRWIEVGPLSLQPSEFMKVALVMMLASYYDWLPDRRVSHPLWVIVPVFIILLPTALVIAEPNLGTSIMLVLAGAGVMFLAGVSLWYFAGVGLLVGGAIASIFVTRGTRWQFLHDYQYQRIDTFLNPSAHPLGAGYNIIQAKIALGSGGMTGKGFMQGTQSRLNFLPEKQTDFIFTTLGEEFGFVGSVTLLTLYAIVLIFLVVAAVRSKERFSQLMIMGLALNFFLYIAVNMSMVMGMAPVVGVPLPLVSYGGSAMLVLVITFGLVQSAIVHRAR